MLSNERIGKFTSSQVYRLMPKLRSGEPAASVKTYIEEVAIEARLGRILNSAASGRPCQWGHALEPRVAQMVEFEYEYCSDKTIVHPEYSCWAGTPDLIGKDKVADIKCPYTMKSFVQLTDIVLAGDKEALKKDFPEYFWQLVSNAILTNKQEAELIVYCPLKSELESIRDELSERDDTDDQTELQWIFFAKDEALPYVIDGGYYKNLNRFPFSVDDADCAQLVNAILMGSSALKELQLASSVKGAQ